MEGNPFTYHVLLIGIDKYPTGYRNLYGSVNDIDLIERLVLQTTEAAQPDWRAKVTRLAAPHAGVLSTSRFAASTRLPTRSNIVLAMREMSKAARPGDRALIYYCGHGDYLRWEGATTLHEAIVTCDLEFLYDVEVNVLVNDIADSFAGDLTIVLDCCYSAGIFREAGYNGDAAAGEASGGRYLEPLNNRQPAKRVGPPPDPALLMPRQATWSTPESAAMLRVPEPNYVVITACQAVEIARERPVDGPDYYGLLTYALSTILGGVLVEHRTELRWGDIWPRVLLEVERLNRFAPRSPQHPWLVGRSERRIFGGAWRKQDLGFSVSAKADGNYHIAAGSLMGVTPGALLSIYGREPDLFPKLDTEQDLRARIGTVRVTEGNRIEATAELVEGLQAGLPEGGVRGRLTASAPAERLSVSLDPPDPQVEEFLTRSSTLRMSEPGTGDAEVWVRGTRMSGWTIGDEITPEVAVVPPDALAALRAGLVEYAMFNATLRLTRLISPLGHDDPLDVTLLSCNDKLRADASGDPHSPDLPVLEAVSPFSYLVPSGSRFCIRVRNRYVAPLYVNVFNCEAFGRVDHMGELTVRPNDQQVLWQNYIPYYSWVFHPSSRRIKEPQDTSSDRLVIVATSRAGVPLGRLATRHTVQEVVDAVVTSRSSGIDALDRLPAPAPPPELWVAQMIVVRIGPEVRTGLEPVIA